MTERTTLRMFAINDEAGTRTVELAAGSHVFGRDPGCDVMVVDKKISRRHVKIIIVGDEALVEDLGSSNGTYLNGQRLERRVLLADGDEIGLGDAVVTFGEPAAAPEFAPAAGPAVGGRPSRPSSARVGVAKKSSSASMIVPLAMLIVAGIVVYSLRDLLAGKDPTPKTVATEKKVQFTSEEFARVERKVEECLTSEDFAEAERCIEEFAQRWGAPAVVGMKTNVRKAIDKAAAETRAEFTRLDGEKANDAAIAFLRRRLRVFPVADPAYAQLSGLLDKASNKSTASRDEGPDASDAAVGIVAKQGNDTTAPRSDVATAAPEKAVEKPNVPKNRDVTPGPAIPRDEARKKYTETKPQADSAFIAKKFEDGRRLYTDVEVFARAAGLPPAMALDAARRRRIFERCQRAIDALQIAFAETPDRFREITAGDDARGIAKEVSEAGLTLEKGGQKRRLHWNEVPGAALATIVKQAQLLPEKRIDAASFVLLLGAQTEGHEILRSVETGFPKLAHPAIDHVLADDLAIEYAERPFVWQDTAYVSPADWDRIQMKRLIDLERPKLWSAQPTERAAAYQKFESLGEAARSAYHDGLIEAKNQLIAKAQATAGWKKLGAIAKTVKDLETARAAALELIYDEEKYPYPYNGVGAEVLKRFTETQQEIDKRTRVVKELWESDQRTAIGHDILDLREHLIEINARLGKVGLGQGPDTLDGLLHLPSGADGVTVKNFAASADERARIDESLAWIKMNEADVGITTKNELDEIRITNEYRMMMGRHALRVHPLLVKSARGHSQDMSRLGFFAHENPFEEAKRTPWDRMKLAGFIGGGGSENLAVSGGPSSAHNSWLHSSGHHRNLLSGGWRVFGVGNDGSNWTQNFASSADDMNQLLGQGGATPSSAPVKNH